MKKKLLKILIPAAVVLIAAAVIIAVISSGNSQKAVELSQAGLTAENVTLISHRGMSIYAPENTVEAAEESAHAGYKYVEFDVRRTLDGVWVLMHDSDIDRTTNGKGEISSLTYKQLLRFNIDGNKAEKYGRVTVPTLEDMLVTCSENVLTPVIEIKQDGTEHIPELMRITSDLCNKCMFITFDREQAELIYSTIAQGRTKLHPDNVTVMWLTNDLDSETLQTAKSNTEIGVSFNGNKAGTAEEIKSFTDAGINLAVWTINEPERLRELYDLGIRYFTTDNIVFNPANNGDN